MPLQKNKNLTVGKIVTLAFNQKESILKVNTNNQKENQLKETITSAAS